MDEKTLCWICQLAQIELSPREKQELINDVQDLLDHFGILSALPRQKLDHHDRRIFLRKDEVIPSSPAILKGILQNFPRESQGMLKVSGIQPEAKVCE